MLQLPYFWGRVMTEDINKLFSEYAVRRQETQASEQKLREQRMVRQQKAYGVFTSTVLPTLRDIAAVSKANGHRAELKEAGNSRPSVRFEFLVRDARLPSTLHIDHDDATDQVSMRRVVNTDSATDHESSESVSISVISEELVRTTAVDFVRAVLQASGV